MLEELWGVVLPEELLEPREELLPLLRSELPVLEPVLLPPGLKALPVAEAAPDKPKYEKTLWRQLGWVRSVFASKFGADWSLLWSPLNVKVGCCELELVLLVADELLPDIEGRSSIQGTATCFPPAELVEAVEELIPVLLEVELGVVLLLLAPPSLKEMTANSSRPEFGLTMKSLTVPICVPEEPLTCAPVSWLPRNAS